MALAGWLAATVVVAVRLNNRLPVLQAECWAAECCAGTLEVVLLPAYINQPRLPIESCPAAAASLMFRAALSMQGCHPWHPAVWCAHTEGLLPIPEG
jgi:hypothetical protein